MKKTTSPTVTKQPVYSTLALFLNNIHPLCEEAMACIGSQSVAVNIAKGKFLIKPGINNDMLYLVVKGVVRGFFKEGGREITTWINAENEVVGAIRNLRLNIPSDEYVQAIEDSELVTVPDKLISHLYENFPETNIIGRLLLEDNYRGAEERAYISRIPSAEKRYKRFVQTNGELLNRIPLKYIASYLGMTLETMSRIRSKK